MKIASISIGDYSDSTEGMPHDVERLYFRIILKIYSREMPLPDVDRDNARIFGYQDVRTYKTVKQKLLNWPNTIYIEDGLIRNERAEREIADYQKAKAEAVDNGRKGGQAKAKRGKTNKRSPSDRKKIGARSGRDQPKISGTSSEDRREIDQRSDEDRDEIGATSAPDVETISDATINEISGLTLPSPSPSISVSKNISYSHSHTTCATETHSDGVSSDVEAIRHPNFTISLQAIAMSICGRWPPDKIRDFCLAHALQWGAEIANGKLSRDVVPDKIVNFLSATIMREINRAAASETVRPGKPSSVHPKIAREIEAREAMRRVQKELEAQ